MNAHPHGLRGALVAIRPIEPDDSSVVLPWFEDLAFARSLLEEIAGPWSRADVDHLLTGGRDDHVLAVRELDDPVIVGFVGLQIRSRRNRSALLYCAMGPAHRGRGYGTEALRIVLAWAFDELDLHRIGARVISHNPGAMRFYERLGFVSEGVERESVRRHGKWHDVHLYGLLAPEHRA